MTMIRRSFLATLFAPFLKRFFPKPKPDYYSKARGILNGSLRDFFDKGDAAILANYRNVGAAPPLNLETLKLAFAESEKMAAAAREFPETFFDPLLNPPEEG